MSDITYIGNLVGHFDLLGSNGEVGSMFDLESFPLQFGRTLSP